MYPSRSLHTISKSTHQSTWHRFRGSAGGFVRRLASLREETTADQVHLEQKRSVCDTKTPAFLGEKGDPTATEEWQAFLDGGMNGVSRATTVVREGKERVKLLWADGHESEFCCKWLRDHDPAAFNSESRQRELDTYSVPNSIRVQEVSVAPAQSTPCQQTNDPEKEMGTTGASMGIEAQQRQQQQQQALRIRWKAPISAAKHDKNTMPGKQGSRQQHPGNDTDSTQTQQPDIAIPTAWLRRHCTSPVARELRERSGNNNGAAFSQPFGRTFMWGADVFSRPDAPCFDFGKVMSSHATRSKAPQSTPGSSGVNNGHAALRFSEGSVFDSGKGPKNILENSPGRDFDNNSERMDMPVVQLLRAIRSHGIALVRGVPPDEAGTEKLALSIGHHLRSTLYGPGMWSTSVDLEADRKAFTDSAYGMDTLELHTDCTYLADPPGLQIFSCVKKAEEGGASVFIDGFAVAERLRVENQEAFKFFTRVSLSYQSFDSGSQYRAEGPIFRLGALGRVVQVRHNDYDRAPLDYLSNDDIARFYEYHDELSRLLRDPSMAARILLKPGEAVILNNQRTLHGREGFKGLRKLVGCYIGMDEVESTARLYGV